MKPASDQSKRARCLWHRFMSLAAVLGAGVFVVVLCTALGPGTDSALPPAAAVSSNCATRATEIAPAVVAGADQTNSGAPVAIPLAVDSSTNRMPGARAETVELGAVTTEQPEPGQVCVNTNIIPPSDTLPEGLWFSPSTQEFIKLVRAGVDESVLASYIRHAPGTFNLRAEHIIYLVDLGVSAELIDAMLEHDRNFGLTTSTTAQLTQMPVQQETTPVETASAVTAQQSQRLPGDSTGTEIGELRPTTETTTVNHYYFYEALAPYGSWLLVDGLGWCWRPTVVVIHRGWMPYCHGGWWVYTSFGWYWCSRYSWGSIVFHYGRWFYHPVWGWCWWPDTVWAPAWVLWRHNDVYCGWAPLPPRTWVIHGKGMVWRGRPVPPHHHFDLRPDHFTYVRWADIHRRDLDRHRPPQHQLEVLHRDTAPRVELVSDERGLVIHRGPIDEFEKRFGRPTPKELVLDRVPTKTGNLIRARLADRSGASSPILPDPGTGDRRLDRTRADSQAPVPGRVIRQERSAADTQGTVPRRESGVEVPRVGLPNAVDSGNRRTSGESDRPGFGRGPTQDRGPAAPAKPLESRAGTGPNAVTVRDGRPVARFGSGPEPRNGSAGASPSRETVAPRASLIIGPDRSTRESPVRSETAVRETRRETMPGPVSRSDLPRTAGRTGQDAGRGVAYAGSPSETRSTTRGGNAPSLRGAGGDAPVNIRQSGSESTPSAPVVRSEPVPSTRSFQPAAPTMSAPVIHSHGARAPAVPGGGSGIPARSGPVARTGKIANHQ